MWNGLGFPTIGRAGLLNLGIVAKFMCTDPKQMKKFREVYPNAIFPGSGKIKVDLITAEGATWDLIASITRYLARIRAGALSPLPDPEKIKLMVDVNAFCEKLEELKNKASVAHLITFVYRVWHSLNRDFPDPLKTWAAEDIRDAINNELIAQAGKKGIKAVQQACQIAQRAAQSRNAGRGRSRNRNRTRNRSFGNGQGFGGTAGRGRVRGAAARPANPKHNTSVRLPRRVGETDVCIYFNKGTCAFASCKWAHVCCYCGKTPRPYYECKCAGALQALKPAPLNLMNV